LDFNGLKGLKQKDNLSIWPKYFPFGWSDWKRKGG